MLVRITTASFKYVIGVGFGVCMGNFPLLCLFRACAHHQSIVADVGHSVSARPSELEGRQFDPRHSVDVCFDFPLFRVAVALSTRKTEHGRSKGGKWCAPRATSLSV